MAEELTLTDPVVVPEKVTDKYHVTSLTMTTELPAATPPGIEPGMLAIQLRDNQGGTFSHSYTGAQAIDMIKWLNTGNFTTTSMHKKILNRLSTDGFLPGTVTGAPEPPPASDPF
jgi:hypothetical protein